MFSKIRFHITKIYIIVFVTVLNLLNIKWKKVENIYLPFVKSIGFNTLRWINNGKYENAEIQIVKAYLDENDIVLEIGTGLGFISAFCAKKIGSNKVFTFEANPLNVDMAKKVFRKNGVNPSLQNAILSLESGVSEFPVNEKSRLASTIYSDIKKVAKVNRLNLNEVIENMSPTFLIMDIEGAEYEIFSIIKFQTIQKIQVEMHPAIIGVAKCEKMFKILKYNGFIKANNPPDGRNYYFYKN